MPANFAAFTADLARLDHTFDDGQTLYIVYRPSELTPRQLERLQFLESADPDTLSKEDKEELLSVTSAALAQQVHSWDLTHKDGSPVIPTVEGLKDVPYAVQSGCLKLINADIRLGKRSGTKPSQASSTDAWVSNRTLTGESLPLRSGTTVNRLPNGSELQ